MSPESRRDSYFGVSGSAEPSREVIEVVAASKGASVCIGLNYLPEVNGASARGGNDVPLLLITQNANLIDDRGTEDCEEHPEVCDRKPIVPELTTTRRCAIGFARQHSRPTAGCDPHFYH